MPHRCLSPVPIPPLPPCPELDCTVLHSSLLFLQMVDSGCFFKSTITPKSTNAASSTTAHIMQTGITQ